MAEDLTPTIVDAYDDTRFDELGKTKRVVVTRFKIGRFGPFEHVCAADKCNETELRQAFEARAAALRPFSS